MLKGNVWVCLTCKHKIYSLVDTGDKMTDLNKDKNSIMTHQLQPVTAKPSKPKTTSAPTVTGTHAYILEMFWHVEISLVLTSFLCLLSKHPDLKHGRTLQCSALSLLLKLMPWAKNATLVMTLLILNYLSFQDKNKTTKLTQELWQQHKYMNKAEMLFFQLHMWSTRRTRSQMNHAQSPPLWVTSLKKKV